MLWTSRIVCLLLILSIVTSTITCEEVEDEREFDYIKGSEKGPAHWGELKKEWRTCKTGRRQSPIDLLHRRVSVIPKWAEVSRFYRPGRAALKNRGHDIQIKWKDRNNKIKINGSEYILLQSHWHSPSEHTINGTRFDLELHMVHQNKHNKIAVIGLLYKIGRPNLFLHKLMNKIESIGDSHKEINIGMINPQNISMRGRRYYRYTGSLTTPPCTEGVLWTVNEQIGTVSAEQVEVLREAVHDHSEKNARPLQPLNGRNVKLYAQQIKKNNISP